MCGIAGLVSPSSCVSEEAIASMNRRLAHRGPDGHGTYCDQKAGVGLGHHRLSILDLTSAGRQPMSTDDGRFTIVFNGEIYNYLELRKELEASGEFFSTNCDTEVLLKGYRRWREKVVDRLLGMFAFAIWDRDARQLFLVRDRAGKKPLLYFWNEKTFAFASELKSLLTLPECQRRLNADAVDVYFALGYIPAPLSIIQNVHKLPPGHCLTLRGEAITIRRYWRPELATPLMAATREARIEQFRDLFADAVRIRLRSDVPVGLFLSGGIDSSAIAAECQRQSQSLKAYTVTFDRDDTDLPYALSVARHLRLDHKVIEASGTDVIEDIPKIIDFYDEPFADTSNVPSYYIARNTGPIEGGV